MLPWLTFLLLILGCLIFFYRRPLWGLGIVIFFAPFIGLIIDFSQSNLFRQIPYLNSIQASLADILVLILGSAIFIKILIKIIKKKETLAVYRTLLTQTGFFFFLPFLIVGLFSIFNVPALQLGGSIKYWLRPIFFSYLMWLLLPYLIVTSSQELNRLLKIFFSASILSALLGWLSIFHNSLLFSWQRLVPTSLWGIAPLTYNHNVLAEVLIAAVPLAFYFFAYNSTGSKNKKIMFLVFVFLILTTLLTFSRAAWISLIFELIIYLYLKNKKRLTSKQAQTTGPAFWQQTSFLSLLLLPFIIYMFYFSLSSIATSSNNTRLDMTGIAWTYFTEHPWLGNGVGTFMNLLSDTRLFTVEYGDPLEAHGIVQKLLAEEGLLGLITFFIFIGWILKTLYRGLIEAKDVAAQHLELALFLAVGGSLIFQLFNTSYYNPHMWLPLGLALVAKKIHSV